MAIYETQVGSRPSRLEDAFEEAESEGRVQRHRDEEARVKARALETQNENNGDYGDGGAGGVL